MNSTPKAEQALPPWRGVGRNSRDTKPLLSSSVHRSFDRIGKLGNSSTMKARLQEEVRLAELAQSTTTRYTDMGVLGAVAGGN